MFGLNLVSFKTLHFPFGLNFPFLFQKKKSCYNTAKIAKAIILRNTHDLLTSALIWQLIRGKCWLVTHFSSVLFLTQTCVSTEVWDNSSQCSCNTLLQGLIPTWQCNLEAYISYYPLISRFELWWEFDRPTWSLACEKNIFWMYAITKLKKDFILKFKMISRKSFVFFIAFMVYE